MHVALTFALLLLQLSWHYNGEKVRAEDVAGTNPLRLTWDGTLSSNHSGQYSCRAENEVATVTKSFTLTVRGRCVRCAAVGYGLCV